ncbi:14917_t:CDS:2 [Funneliformis mosseae]|uniref:14917_t:CDS:1 n=1 Tax=Funneliformis mosseae TaxID=27381 RepID=A0A9N9N4Q0_FUNMO|nr:14917_t:CDS:2 [Funneliformis mosseae]
MDAGSSNRSCGSAKGYVRRIKSNSSFSDKGGAMFSYYELH